MIQQNGQVAIAYYQTIPHAIKINKKYYAFVVKANICMAWVDEGDVSQVLATTRTCCGGHKSVVYRYANENDVRRWTVGGGS